MLIMIFKVFEARVNQENARKASREARENQEWVIYQGSARYLTPNFC